MGSQFRFWTSTRDLEELSNRTRFLGMWLAAITVAIAALFLMAGIALANSSQTNATFTSLTLKPSPATAAALTIEYDDNDAAYASTAAAIQVNMPASTSSGAGAEQVGLRVQGGHRGITLEGQESAAVYAAKQSGVLIDARGIHNGSLVTSNGVSKL